MAPRASITGMMAALQQGCKAAAGARANVPKPFLSSHHEPETQAKPTAPKPAAPEAAAAPQEPVTQSTAGETDTGARRAEAAEEQEGRSPPLAVPVADEQAPAPVAPEVAENAEAFSAEAAE